MKVEVLFFATLKDRARTGRLSVEFEGAATVGDLKARLASARPELAPALPTALVSVNREFAFAEDRLKDGDEVALFPPVSGGGQEQATRDKGQGEGARTVYHITNEVMNLDELVRSITRPSTGAAVVFTGMVRGVTARDQAHETDYLEYEAYTPMAEAKMKQVAEEIRRQWPSVEGIAIVQRIGRLAPGTPTVLIACAAAHRDTGVFEAARYGIDRLKEIVPIWKKEVGPDGATWVEGGYLPDEGDRAAG